MPNIASKPPEARGEAWHGLPHSPRNQLCQHSDLSSRLQNCGTIRFCCSSPQCVVLCSSSSSKLMHVPTYTSLVGLGTWLGFLENNPAICSKLFTLSNQHSLLEYYWAIKRNKLLIHATTMMNRQRIVLSEGS